jgi:hypothetical protein
MIITGVHDRKVNQSQFDVYRADQRKTAAAWAKQEHQAQETRSKRVDERRTNSARSSAVWQFCAGEHEANLRLSSATSSASILKVLNTYSPSMSYLEPSPSSLQSKEIIGQGAVSGESQRQRYASLSGLCLSAL